MTASTASVLPLEPGRDRLMRFESASVLGRFHYLEQALTLTCAAWIPAVHRLDTKAALARAAWQDAMTADALRDRVFELRYPDRTLERDANNDALVRLYEASLHAPSGSAVLRLVAEVLAPALADAYRRYLSISDLIADGPSHRFLDLAVREKGEQQQELAAAAAIESRWADEENSEAWLAGFVRLLEQLGGIPVEQPASELEVTHVIAPGKLFALCEDPVRDERYAPSTFYWPDSFDPDFPYGRGVDLQLRSAISHLNEVWAVESAAAVLLGLSGQLGWEFTRDAARWLYDESRHMMMGKHRLEWWGLEPHEIPLGSYIYEACAGEEVLYRLGMLAYFETKNIGKKRTRVAEFERLGDRTSGRDMDFDWADESIHAGYGRRWLKAATARTGHSWSDVIAHCEELVAARIARATDEEKATSYAHAERLLQAARERATATGSSAT